MERSEVKALEILSYRPFCGIRGVHCMLKNSIRKMRFHGHGCSPGREYRYGSSLRAEGVTKSIVDIHESASMATFKITFTQINLQQYKSASAKRVKYQNSGTADNAAAPESFRAYSIYGQKYWLNTVLRTSRL